MIHRRLLLCNLVISKRLQRAEAIYITKRSLQGTSIDRSSVRISRPRPAQFRPVNIVLKTNFTSSANTMASATTFYGFKTKDKTGNEYPLGQHQGKVILAVNTASKCGFTPQFGGLESLWKKVKATPNGEDFLILGFPCNQFGGQDPGSNDQIQEFCQLNYGVTFPVHLLLSRTSFLLSLCANMLSRYWVKPMSTATMPSLYGSG